MSDMSGKGKYPIILTIMFNFPNQADNIMYWTEAGIEKAK